MECPVDYNYTPFLVTWADPVTDLYSIYLVGGGGSSFQYSHPHCNNL